MALSKEKKEKIVAELQKALANVDSMIFTDFTGLSVAKTRELRSKLKNIGAVLKVAKKTLLRRALKNPAAEPFLGPQSKTPVSVIFGSNDVLEMAKILYKFSKSEALKILGGILKDRFLNSAEIEVLAKLPSRQELLARLIGNVQAPIRNLVGVLQGNLYKLVFILEAIKNKK